MNMNEYIKYTDNKYYEFNYHVDSHYQIEYNDINFQKEEDGYTYYCINYDNELVSTKDLSKLVILRIQGKKIWKINSIPSFICKDENLLSMILESSGMNVSMNNIEKLITEYNVLFQDLLYHIITNPPSEVKLAGFQRLLNVYYISKSTYSVIVKIVNDRINDPYPTDPQ